MALNLARFKATITDGGGTQASTLANRNGLQDEDTATNVIEVAAEETFIIHYDLGEAYEIDDIKVWASTQDTAFWVIQVSNNNVNWTTATIATEGTYIHTTDVAGGYQYIKITCDTTGRAAISPREYKIDADTTKMKYQAGASSSAIGFGADTGTWQPYGVVPYGGWFVIVDTEHPATADGYLVALTYIKKGTMYGSYTYVYILRNLGDTWKVVQKSPYYLYYDPNARPLVIDPPLKFKTGDIIAIQAMFSATDYPSWRGDAEAGKSFVYLSRETAYSVGDTITKSDYTTKANWEFKDYSYSYADIPIGSGDDNRGSTSIPIADRYISGSVGASIDPKVVNLDVLGTTPWLDFYPVVSSLSSEINNSETTIPLHDASNFPQAGAGAIYGGKFQIENEKCTYKYISGNNTMECARGVDGTNAVGHSSWSIVKDISTWIEISIDNSNFYASGDAQLPLALGSSMPAAGSKTFYLRANLPFTYQEDKQIYSSLSVLWGV